MIVAVAPDANHGIIHDDIRIENLAGKRIRPAWSHGERASGHNPAEEIVPDIFRIKLGEFVGVGLLANGHHVSNTGFFKRFVPEQDTFADVAAVFNRHGFFYIEDDLVIGVNVGDLFRGIAFSQVPAIDITFEHGFIIMISAPVLACLQEITDPVIGLAGLVIWFLAIERYCSG